MPQRHPLLPRLWLMTDERMGDRLLPAVAALPKGSGIVFRHYSLPWAERLSLFGKVRRIARKRRHLLVFAGLTSKVTSLGADGAHGRQFGAFTAPVHSIRERIEAERRKAQLIFVSPAFTTASHPGEGALGRVRFGQLVQGCRVPVIALGGMNRDRARGLTAFGIHGWAAIDALTVSADRTRIS